MPVTTIAPLLRVADVARSLHFYQRLLDLPALGEFTPEGRTAPVWANLGRAAVELMLGLAEDPRATVERVSPDLTSWCVSFTRSPAGIWASAMLKSSLVSTGISSSCGPSGSVAQRLNAGLRNVISSMEMPASSAAILRSICPPVSICAK